MSLLNQHQVGNMVEGILSTNGHFTSQQAHDIALAVSEVIRIYNRDLEVELNELKSAVLNHRHVDGRRR